ncbi:hypothetical protein SERLA73DRAFT_190673 [Serpula lacrymans var. lacrymans S7.3]|uniref:Proteasome maturation factor UMP1 n=2 Tax=Serpula lacrymans var. lacrymans TaxID=341189 RepID=F8QG58_SERL3|nr:hypothetical protein SERLA73DRAFT_190673 [Serpula lacrymans var. lacrymans S7.3]
MDSSLRIVPAAASKSASISGTAGSLGLHDTLRYGPRSIAAETRSNTALKNRLERWEETQDNMKLNVQRNLYGLHAPVRLLMERKIVTSNAYTPIMPQSNLHLDILMGRDESIEPVDFFGGMDNGPPLDIHSEMEKRLRL